MWLIEWKILMWWYVWLNETIYEKCLIEWNNIFHDAYFHGYECDLKNFDGYNDHISRLQIIFKCNSNAYKWHVS
jgi:hypothetical protein